MLTRAENELLTRVGPGTPMGAMLREYWTPAVRAAALEADGAPIRVRLMGENFVAFRATDGRVGFFDEGCPHRCTSLALARNEDNALTCIFHGWKMDVSGKVVDVPSEPPERRAEFAAKVRVRHYPVREAGGIIWVYLGKREQPPPFFDFEFNRLPSAQVQPWRAVVHGNWLQNFEGVLDSAHVGILHQGNIRNDEKNVGIVNDFMLANANTAPAFDFMDRPYGFREAALRTLPGGAGYVRIREVVWPSFSFIPTQRGHECAMVCATPIDDQWTAQWYVIYLPERAMTDYEARWADHFFPEDDPNYFNREQGGRGARWGQDRRRMKEGHWTGITRSVPYEDFAMQQAQGVIVDRAREYLGSSDIVIIRTRRMLLDAVRAFAQGAAAIGLGAPVDYGRIRSLSTRYPAHKHWSELDAFAPPSVDG